jgi:hypothetical protein
MPASIGTSEHVTERILLFELVMTQPLTENHAQIIKQGIDFVYKACLQNELAQTYRSLAQSSYYALKRENPIILEHCMKQPQSEVQQKTLSVIAKLYATLCKQSDSPVLSKENQDIIRRAIKTMDSLYGKAVEGSEQAQKSLNNIVGPSIITFPVKTVDGTQELKTYIKQPTLEESVSRIVMREKFNQIVDHISLHRAEAIAKYKIEGEARVLNVITLSDEAKQFLAENGVYPPNLMKMYVNVLQKQAQQEFADIAEKSAKYYYSLFKDKVKDATVVNAQLVDVGIDYTRENNVAQAYAVADCCNKILKGIEVYDDYSSNILTEQEKKILEYTKIIAQGAHDGLANSAQYVKDHPIEAAATVLVPEVMVPYHISKLTLDALDIAYNRLSKINYRTLTTDKIKAKFDAVYQAFRRTPGPEIVRKTTALGTQMLIDGKVASNLNTLSKAALAKLTSNVQKMKNIKELSHDFALASKTQQKIPVRNQNLMHASENHAIKQQKVSIPSLNIDKNNTKAINTPLSKLNQSDQLKHINKLKQVLMQRAIQKEQEFLKANAGLSRTIDRAREELALRVARLEMQYGKETVQEALSLFNTSDQKLVKNIYTVDKLEEITVSLDKINSNPQWRSWKFDIEKGNKVTIGSIEEASAAVACEQQGLLIGLNRSHQKGADFMQVFEQKKDGMLKQSLHTH